MDLSLFGGETFDEVLVDELLVILAAQMAEDGAVETLDLGCVPLAVVLADLVAELYGGLDAGEVLAEGEGELAMLFGGQLQEGQYRDDCLDYSWRDVKFGQPFL